MRYTIPQLALPDAHLCNTYAPTHAHYSKNMDAYWGRRANRRVRCACAHSISSLRSCSLQRSGTAVQLQLFTLRHQSSLRIVSHTQPQSRIPAMRLPGRRSTPASVSSRAPARMQITRLRNTQQRTQLTQEQRSLQPVNVDAMHLCRVLSALL